MSESISRMRQVESEKGWKRRRGEGGAARGRRRRKRMKGTYFVNDGFPLERFFT